MQRLAVFNQKGGVGKTTTVLNLAGAIARRRVHPVLVDLDAQAHLTSILAPEPGANLFAFYNESKPLRMLTRPVALGADGAGEIIPSHSELVKVDTLFGKGPNILNKLKDGLDAAYEEANGAPALGGSFTGNTGAGAMQGGIGVSPSPATNRPILIDCCPMLGVLSLSGIFAAERVLIPVSTDFLSLRGALALENTLHALEHVMKQRVPRRYLLTRFDGRRRMSHDIAEQLAERFGDELCRTRIAENVSVAESPVQGRDIFRHAPDSRGAKDYEALLEELLAEGFLEI
jgi:chromosome partitioning protein